MTAVATPAWRCAMEPLYEEYDIASLDRIDGTVPPDLNGVLYRVGPGKHDVGGHTYDHWLDGDGMVRAFRFADGRVSFKNRYVRTPWFEKESRVGRPLYPNFATRSVGGLLKSAVQGGPKNPVARRRTAPGVRRGPQRLRPGPHL